MRLEGWGVVVWHSVVGVGGADPLVGVADRVADRVADFDDLADFDGMADRSSDRFPD